MRWWERIIPVVVTALVFGAGYGWAGDISYPGGPSGSLLSGTVVDGDDVELLSRTHATDCSSLTDGVAGEFCTDLDDGKEWRCVPSAGACDTAGEWVSDALATYTPTTSADWPSYSTNTVISALDYLATRVRFAMTALTGRYDSFVDLTGGVRWDGIVPTTTANRCQLLQAAFAPYITGSDTERLIGVTGAATVAWSDLYDLGPYRTCIGVWRSAALTAGYPQVVAADYNLTNTNPASIDVDWLSAQLSLGSMAGNQTEPVVFYQVGAGWLFGRTDSSSSTGGAISHRWSEHGKLRLLRSDDSDGGWVDGRIPQSSPTTFLASSTSTVMMSAQGLQRADRSRLFVEISGNSADNDDVGFLGFNQWGTHYGPFWIRSMGTGAIWYSNNIGVYEGWYVAGNDVGVVLGDATVGGDPPLSSSCACASGACTGSSSCTLTTSVAVYGLHFRDLITESDLFGQIVGFDVGSENLFSKYRNEATSADIRRHQVIFGAGICGDETGTADDYKTCGTNAECPTTATCTTVTNPTLASGVTFRDSLFGGDGGWTGAASCVSSGNPQPCCTGAGAGANCVDYDGIYIGKGTATNNSYGRLRFEDSLILSSTAASAPTLRVFGASAGHAQRAPVYFAGNDFYDDNAGFPPYKVVLADKTTIHTFEFNETGVSGDTTKCLPKVQGALVACSAASDATIDVPVPLGGQFYARGGCTLYDATGWADTDTVVASVQEIGADGALDTALPDGIRFMGNNYCSGAGQPSACCTGSGTGTCPAAFAQSSSKDNSNPKQALGVMGASDAVFWRLRLTTTTDATDDIVFKGKCWVETIPSQAVKNLIQYGCPGTGC